MAQAVQGIVELLRMGGPWAVAVLCLAWAVAERVHNIREGRANTKSLIDLATAQIAALTKMEGAITATTQQQRELLLITLGKRK